MSSNSTWLTVLNILRRTAKPLASRKVRVALTTVVAAYCAEWGLDVSDTQVLTILGVGVAVILGIATEDAGTKANPNRDGIDNGS